mmetsp:Transcript_103248/g.181994  ORF Transcript_103248/g.181994 Transcript_103248/m.181994 type:complete len:216 (+) Transcript_103248:2-649(+)
MTYEELVDALSDQLALEGFRIDKETLDFEVPQVFELELPDDEADILRGPFSDAKVVVERQTIVLRFKEMRKGEQSIKDARAATEESSGDSRSTSVPAEASRPEVHSSDASSSSSWSSWFRPVMEAPAFLLNGTERKGRLESISEEPNQVPQETSIGKSLSVSATPSVNGLTSVSIAQETSGTRPRPKRKVERPGSAPPTPTLSERGGDLYRETSV